MLKKLFKIFVVLFVVILSIGCSDSKPDRLIKEVKYDENISKIIPFDTNKSIYVYAHYNDGTKKDITKLLNWSSSQTDIADVTDDGVVKAKSITGNVDIHYETKDISSDGTPFYQESITFSVEDLKLLSIELEPKSMLNIFTGEQKNVIATANFEKNVTDNITSDADWSSDDNSTAIIVDKGVVEGKSQGVTKIIVKYKGESQTLDVNVTKIEYSSLSIESTKTDFNVKQTIQLEARATDDRDNIVVLKNSNVTWDSDNTTIITIDNNGLATAQAKGSTIITANITGSDEKNTITLNVIEDEYMRLFKDGEELEFPYVSAKGYEALPTDLSEFTIVAVGRDFIISELNVTNSDGTVIDSASFDFMENGDVINKDDNITFELKYDDSKKELNYHFKIDDDSNSTFDVKYYETNN